MSFPIPDATEFWMPIIYKDGRLDEEQVMKELSDYAFILQQVPTVYCEITDNRMSKPHYTAEAVIEQFNECNYNKRWTQRDVRGMLEKVTTLDELRDELAAYFELDLEAE